MFESLSTRLQDVFKSLRGEARLTEATVDTALREIRLALLEADVNFRVVKAFIERVRVKAVGDEVLKSLTPDQHVVRIVRDEMLALFGDAAGGLPPATQTPRVILMLGLQGAGRLDRLEDADQVAGADAERVEAGHQLLQAHARRQHDLWRLPPSST